jgi:superfamily II DNA or RNA helicase/HKD family nuclease
VPEGVDDGLYESLRTARLERRLQSLPAGAAVWDKIGSAAAPEVLARHVAEVVRRTLSDHSDDARREALVNKVVGLLEASDDDAVVALEQLLAISVAPGVHRVVRPATPLSETALLTNTPDEPSLGAELRAEVASADQVDLLCAFVKFHGMRLLTDELEELRTRGKRLRVITTTYLGGTERRAVDELVRRFGAEVRIRYEEQSTRLHAKAWLFRRNTGFDTGYVGSSNLSKSALVDGLEWNVRISSVATPALVRKFEATFDTYWNSPDFRPYDPDRDADLLDRALAAQAGGGSPTLVLSGLEVRPRPHQERILEALDAERTVHGRHRNLVVAATGTGKTVVAALDYRRLGGAERSLLFVAHRKELLEQARRTYREVLGDGTFGELLVGGERPTRWRHVFASVQSLREVELGAYDIAVIDEFHHAEAPSYRALLERLVVDELLGLTATPDRADGIDVREFFDGRTAVEIGLGEALEQDLLCPFHYFGIADNTDLSSMEWKRGSYDVDALDQLYTGNDARTRLVLNALQARVADPQRMRALGFCVSVAHAEYMATKFSEAGIPSRAVTGQTPAVDRDRAAADLRRGDVACLFTVDLYNEGVDLPTVDTVLFLRPTQSATIFLQQLGRGLRRAPGKAVLTVLDFIGQHRREFRFDLRYRALTGSTRAGLVRDIEQGFPYLPSGSRLLLDRVAQEVVLANVRQGLRGGRKALVDDVRSHGDLSLVAYLRESGLELSDVYGRAGESWTALRRGAGFPTADPGPREDELLRRVGSLVHVDDLERASTYMRLMLPDGPRLADLSARERVLAHMLVYTLWPDLGGHASIDEALTTLRDHPAFVREAMTLMRVGADEARVVPGDLGIPGVELRSHCTYRRDEILAGIGWADGVRKTRGQAAGVVYSEATNVDALLVTLRKEDKEFAPSTRYRDYPISADLFHWESQNSTTLNSAAGRRYVDGTSQVLLFTRAARTDEFGGGAPFVCLGTASVVEHHGERPISITWRLDRPMPQQVVLDGALDAA